MKRKSTNRSNCFKCNRYNFSKQNLSRFIKETDEANFQNILTAELYKVNLNGNKTLFKAADMYAGENFSPDGNLMISTIQKPFSYIS
jgi:hypothetical protein